MSNEIKDIIAELKGLIAIKELDDEIEAFVKSASTWECPDGYIFKDENGNVINATKIVLEKKKKEYPKTYEECCDVLGKYADVTYGYKNYVLHTLQMLLVCRDAYLKLYSEENGLEKPWSPDRCIIVYGICREEGCIIKYDDCWGGASVLEFPTREMRDAFYENFKELIETAKELL